MSIIAENYKYNKIYLTLTGQRVSLIQLHINYILLFLTVNMIKGNGDI